MRFSLNEWRKQLFYFKRKNLSTLKNIRGIVNTISFFIVWGYVGYFLATKAEKKQKETGIPHSVQLARVFGEETVTTWDFNSGKKETISKLNRIS